MKKSRVLKNEYLLDGAGIEGASELIAAQLEEWKVERQNRLRIRLSLEESLLRYRDHFGEDVPFVLTIIRRFRKLSFQIELKGEVYNPLSDSENDLQEWNSGLLMTLGMAPRFSYRSNTNILRISLQRIAMNPILRLLIIIGLAALTGFILYVTISEQEAFALIDTVEEPVYRLLYDILNLISGPVIFFMVLSTITGSARSDSKGASYAWVLLRFFFLSIAFALVAVAVTVWICQVSLWTDVLNGSTVRDILTHIFGIVPEDFFEAFIAADTPQLIFLAFVIGAVMNVLSERVGILKKVVDQINEVGLHITEWISWMIPLFVFVLIVIQIIDRKQYDLLRIWLPLLISLVCCILIMAAAIVYVSFRKKVSVKKLIRILWPPFREALVSGSLSESYGLAEKSCHMGLGINKDFTKISLSHGLILYMPGNIISVVTFCIYAANEHGTKITYLWVAALIMLATILSIAAPPVPGVSMLVYIDIFSEMNFDGKALIPALVYDIVFGIFAGAMNQMMLQIEIMIHADKAGLLNRNILLR